MPFITKGKRKIFVSDLHKKGSKDISLVGTGISPFQLEEISKLPDNIIKENLIARNAGTSTELFYLKHRPDLVSKSKLSKFTNYGNH